MNRSNFLTAAKLNSPDVLYRLRHKEGFSLSPKEEPKLYLQDNSSEGSVSLQAVWGGDASLGAAPQLLYSLAHDPPEPVRHQGGREVASIQRLRGAQGGDGAFTWAGKGWSEAGWVTASIHLSHSVQSQSPKISHSSLQVLSQNPTRPGRPLLSFSVLLVHFTRDAAACYSNLVGLFIHTKKVGHSIHHIFTAPKFQGPDGSQFQTNTPGTLMARSHWTRHLSHKNRGQIKNYCSRWNCSRRTCISRNIIGSRPQGCKLH